MSKSMFVCKACGSTNVSRNASVAWDVAKQEWTIVSVYDNADCEACQGETSLLRMEAMPDGTETTIASSQEVQCELNPARGAMDALREAAKMCRLNLDYGHARMCDLHASLIGGILPEPGMRFFTVTGRLVNYDDALPDDVDTTVIFQAKDREHAVAQFAERLGEVRTGRECVVHAVFASATALTECKAPPEVDRFPKAPF